MRPSLATLSCLGFLLGAACTVLDQPPKDPCAPNNPCTQVGKTTCANEGGTARCLCDPGTLPRPSGACEQVTAANCPEHAGDGAEPDDCLSRAAVLNPSTKLPRSIEPAGDYDFFRIDASAPNIYLLTVAPEGGSIVPRVDVFDQGGVWLTSGQGNPRLQLGFKARANAPYYVRVIHTPLDPSVGTGPYSLSLAAPIRDDFGDTPNDASTLTPDPANDTSPSQISGSLAYGQDVDWFSFSARQGAHYRVEFNNASGNTIPTLDIFTNDDLKSPFLTNSKAYVDFQANTTRFYLAIYSARGEPLQYLFRVFEY
jgi:hypothetical protein